MAASDFLTWAIAANVILLIAYYVLHRQIEKFSKIEKVIFQVKRARTSYLLYYLIAVGLFVASYFYLPEWKWISALAGVAIVIAVDIHHDHTRLILTEEKVITVTGYLYTRAESVLYGDIIIVEIYETPMGDFLGYGNIMFTIMGAAGKKTKFVKIPQHMKVKKLIEQKKIEKKRR